MKAKEYTLLTECVERGVSYGWSRAHKHMNNPPCDNIRIAIEEAVLSDICEHFDFEELKDHVEHGGG